MTPDARDEPVGLDAPDALVVTARQLAGRSAFVARTVGLDGLGTASHGEHAIFDRRGRRAGGVLRGAADRALLTQIGADLDAGRARTRVLDVDVDADAAVSAGLTCGGRASIVLQPLDHVPGAYWDALAARAPVALVTDLDRVGLGSVVVDDTRADPPAPAEALERARALLTQRRTAGAIVDTERGRALVEVVVPVTRLVVVGSPALGGTIAELARWCGWTAEHVRVAPDAESTLDALGPCDALVVLDHSTTTTGPLLAAALRSNIGYVGALGSRRTQQRRAAALNGLGVDDDLIARLHGPCGLDIGPASPEEIALAVCAEITAVRAGRRGGPLRDARGHIMA